MKRVLSKLNKTVGFTLAETLMAVAMLVIISAAVLPAALQAYRKAVDAANAHALLSIAVDALRDEFSMAQNAKLETDNGKTVIVYQNTDTGGKSKLYIDENKIMRQEYREHVGNNWVFDETKTVTTPNAYPLISDVLTNQTENVNNKMIVTYDSGNSKVENGIITIKGLKVQKNGNNIVEPIDLVIHYLDLGGEGT